jgi:hypothetical protein
VYSSYNFLCYIIFGFQGYPKPVIHDLNLMWILSPSTPLSSVVNATGVFQL